jgi:hypothetical protein
MPSVGVVVPAFRPDPDRLADTLAAISEALDPAALRVELDVPESSVADRLREGPATVNVADERRGKGAAITAGFEALASGVDRLAFADADGSVPAADLARIVDALDDADLAVGSRRHPEATVATHQTALRRRLGDAFAWSARRFLEPPLHDYQCGAKAVRSDCWSAVRRHLYEPGFAWDLELIATTAALDGTVAEVPVTWRDQAGSTVDTVDTTVELARALVAVRRRTARLGPTDAAAEAGERSAKRALIDRLADET